MEFLAGFRVQGFRVLRGPSIGFRKWGLGPWVETSLNLRGLGWGFGFYKGSIRAVWFYKGSIRVL